MENQIQTLMLEGQKRLILNGVISVDGFSENMLKLTLLSGRLQISGSGIKISSFNKTSGSLSADGSFVTFKFAEKNEPLIKRIFK